MITKSEDTSTVQNVAKAATVLKTNSILIKAAAKIAEPCDKRTISQILRESSGGFSFRR